MTRIRFRQALKIVRIAPASLSIIRAEADPFVVVVVVGVQFADRSAPVHPLILSNVHLTFAGSSSWPASLTVHSEAGRLAPARDKLFYR